MTVPKGFLSLNSCWENRPLVVKADQIAALTPYGYSDYTDRDSEGNPIYKYGTDIRMTQGVNFITKVPVTVVSAMIAEVLK